MNYAHRNIGRRLAICVALLSFATALNAQAAPVSGAQAATAQSPQPPTWKSYSYSVDGFSASYPSVPDLQKKDVPTDAGTFQLRSYIGTDGEVAMFVGICDYGSKTNGQNPDDLLQGAKNGAMQNANAHLLSETKITFGIYHGLTFEMESDQTQKDPAHFSGRIYMVGSTLYQTLVVAPLGKPYADTARFLDSFQLIPRTAN
jgi:hypothetical protein